MNEFFRFQYEIDDALTQSARDLRRLVEFYRRHGKIECANQVEQSSQDGISKSQMSKKQEKNKSSHFHWLHLPEKRVG
jgi:hypothetical protein